MWGGDTYNIHTDLWVTVNASSLTDLLDTRHVSWKSYAEQYVPGPNGACNNSYSQGPFDGEGQPLYARKHVPPILFETVSSNLTRCQNILPSENFLYDLRNETLPEVGLYIPNLVHDGHDSDVSNDPTPFSAGAWLSAWLDQYLPALQEQGVLVMITFDEATTPKGVDPPQPDNQVVSIVLGNSSLVTPNTTYNGYMNHYAITRSIEANFGLGNLGRNDTAPQNGILHDALRNAHHGTAPVGNYTYYPSQHKQHALRNVINNIH